MLITKDLLKEWNACGEGYKWFLQKFPQGGDAHDVGKMLREDRRYDDARWLTEKIFTSFVADPSHIASYVTTEVAHTLKEVEGSPNSSSGNSSTAASSGDSSTAASSGNFSTAASSGDSSKAASSGNFSTAASSGDSSTAASSGDSSKAEAKGEKTIAMVAGYNGRVRAGEKGAFALAYLDAEERVRIAVGIVGENGIKADTWYYVNRNYTLEELA